MWSVWAGMFASALLFSYHDGVNLPFGDSWTLVPVVTGEERLTFEWLWRQHNEHHLPLPKLLLATAGRLAGGDARAGAFLNGFGLALTSGLLIFGARQVRGHTAYSDAFFPLILLHVGNYDALLFDFVINFVATTFFSVLILSAVLSARPKLRVGAAVVAGFSLVALIFCGATGVVLVPALALWLGGAGWLQCRDVDGGVRQAGGVMLATAAAGLLVFGLYFLGYRRTSFHPDSAGVAASLRVATQFLSLGIGPAGGVGWPWATDWPMLTLLVWGASIACLLLLARVARDQPTERVRATGLAAFLSAIWLLALAIGWGRSGISPTVGYSNRYITLAAMLPIAAYWIAGLYLRPLAGRFVQSAMFMAMCGFVVFNTLHGLDQSLQNRAMPEAVIEELRSGATSGELVARYGSVLYPKASKAEMVAWFEMLRKNRMGPFKDLKAPQSPE